MLEFSSTESCTTSTTSTPLVGFSSNDSSCDGNVALMNDFESTGGCSGQGPQGPDGFSAYQIAVFDGFVGTETQWLASLVGPGVPVGGTAGQILAKIDLTNYNTQWINNFALPSLTSGSVLFSNGTTIAQNNANFFWNNANNRLGIGTTTPSYALHVNGVTGSNTFTIPSYNSQLNQNYLMLYGGYGAGMQGTYNNPTGGDLTFGTFINSIFNEKMRLLPSGKLGIGTATPTQLLDILGVNKDAYISALVDTAGKYAGINIGLSGSYGGSLSYNTGTKQLRLSNTGGPGNDSAGILVFATGTNTERMRIDSTGNVGIGTTTPTARLQVKGDGTNPVARFESSAGVQSLIINALGDGHNYGSGGNIMYIVNQNGNSTINGKALLWTSNIDTLAGFAFRYMGNNNHSYTSGNGGLLDIGSSGLTFSAGAGSANFRPLNISYTLNNTGAQTGTATGIFLNATETALNGMTHNLLDLQVGGVSRAKILNSGVINAVSVIATGDIVVGLSSYLGFTGRTVFSSPSNGVLLVTNNAVTDFSRLQLGGTTNLFPSIKRNGTAIHFRLADDSAFCNIKAANLEASIILNNLYYDATGTLAWLLVSSTTAECNFKRSSLFSPSTGTAVASAQVQIDSTTKGFLPPRMTNAERLAILTPAVGLMVYCTDVVEGVYVNKSTGWTFMA